MDTTKIMNTIIRHIEYLTLRHDCVIVAGLGAFIATQRGAQIDMQRGLIVPPCRSLMFNQAVTLDDGLLANSIARKEGISFDEARQVIFREVSILKATILADGNVSLGNVGSMFLGEESKILFTPADKEGDANLKLGFHSISISKAGGETTPLDNPIQEEKLDGEVISNKFHLGKTFLKIAAAAAVAVVVAITFLLNPLPNDDREQRASVVPVDALISKPESTPKEEISEPASILPAETSQEVIEEPSHYLIVATFSNKEEAESYASRYSSEDYPLTTVSSRRMTRVAVASSDNKEELRQRLNSPDIISRYPNAWIWSR